LTGIVASSGSPFWTLARLSSGAQRACHGGHTVSVPERTPLPATQALNSVFPPNSMQRSGLRQGRHLHSATLPRCVAAGLSGECGKWSLARQDLRRQIGGGGPCSTSYTALRPWLTISDRCWDDGLSRALDETGSMIRRYSAVLPEFPATKRTTRLGPQRLNMGWARSSPRSSSLTMAVQSRWHGLGHGRGITPSGRARPTSRRTSCRLDHCKC
jgi:hypothetical protein